MQNTLSFRIQTNSQQLLSDILRISISGLTSTWTPKDSDFSLLAESGKTLTTMECVGRVKCHTKVSLACTTSKCGKLHLTTLDVKIFCTDFDAADFSTFIAYIRVCKSPSSGVSERPPDSFLEIPPGRYSRGPWQNCGGCGHSSRSVLKDYDMGSVITAFGEDLIVEIGASAVISNLFCYDSYPEHRSI